MSTSTLGLFLRHMALSEEVSRLGTASDHNLLTVYESERGQAAFAELMRRHGPMVLRTCRRVLGHGPDAEDAFQATFVLLTRKAGSINKREALSGWLHRVAYRTALNVLAGESRRRFRERQASVMTHPDPDPVTEATWNEVLPILDAELEALPAEARQLLITCYLQGKTHAEAAAELGLPLGSIARHLERARALLAGRLARRGITVSATLLAVVLGESAKGAGVSAVLLVHTLEAARSFTEQAAGAMTEPVARLVQGGLGQMARSSTPLSLVLVGWVGLLGAGLLACQTFKAWPDQKPQSEPPAAEHLGREGNKSALTDRFGDPLPPGALARLGTLRWRHVTSGQMSILFTRDGKGLITAGKGNPVRHWDAATGRILRLFGDSWDDQVCAAALSPDGRTLAGRTGSAGELCLWDVATGTLLQRLKGDRAGHGVVAFSPDGKTVASGGTALRLWETATGKELWTIDKLPVLALTYSAEGRALIAADYEGNLRLLDAATGNELRRWGNEKQRRVSALACSPDGRLFAAYSYPPGTVGGLARLWDMATGKELWHLEDEHERIVGKARLFPFGEEPTIVAAAFSPDGKILATGNNHRPIHLRDAATGKELRHCTGPQSATQGLAFSPDGKTLASGGGFGTGSRHQIVNLWDVASGREVRRADDGHSHTVQSLAFTPDGKDIVSGGWDGSVRVWNAATGEQRRSALPAGSEHFVGGRTGSIASGVSSDGKTFLSAVFEQIEPKSFVKVRRWDRNTGGELPGWSQEIGSLGPASLIFSPDGKTLACTLMSASPNRVCLWETATGKELCRIAGSYPAFSPDGKILATALLVRNRVGQQRDESGAFVLWETATAKKLCSVSVPDARIHDLLFSPDGRMLATASRAIRKPRERRKTRDPQEASQRNVVHIQLWPLVRDEFSTTSVRIGSPHALVQAASRREFGAWAFSPDGRTLALASAGGRVRLVETASGKDRDSFAGHGGDIMALSFAPDGRRLASGSRDTTILVWDVTDRLHGERLRPAQLLSHELEKLWAHLAADDAGRAARAVWTLAADPTRSVPYLIEQLRTSATDVPKRLAEVPQLLRDLDDDTFTVREKAKAELTRLGSAAEPALRLALEKSASLEARRSLEQLLKAVEAKHQTPSGETLRGVRAVEVLEHIGGREAREALKTLTTNASGEPSIIQEARAALDRLGRLDRRSIGQAAP